MKKLQFVALAVVAFAAGTVLSVHGVGAPQTRGVDRSLAYLQMSLPEMAVAELESVKSQLPAEREVYVYFGLLDESLGRLDAAVDRYRQALLLPTKQDPALSPAIITSMIGRALLEQGDYAAAAASFREAIAADNSLALAHSGLGETFEAQGNHIAAITEYEEAMTAGETDDPDLLSSLGRAYLASGQAAKAVERLEEASRLQPKDITIQVNLAKAYAASGDKAAARRSAEHALALEPDNKEIKRLLDTL